MRSNHTYLQGSESQTLNMHLQGQLQILFQALYQMGWVRKMLRSSWQPLLRAPLSPAQKKDLIQKINLMQKIKVGTAPQNAGTPSQSLQSRNTKALNLQCVQKLSSKPLNSQGVENLSAKTHSENSPTQQLIKNLNQLDALQLQHLTMYVAHELAALNKKRILH